QLYLGGPSDKSYTVLSPTPYTQGPSLRPRPELECAGISYLWGKQMGTLLEAEAKATVATLVGQGRPTRLLKVGPYTEETAGALLMHFMLETLLVADLLEVNPFDQPAVEEGKRLARLYLEQSPSV